MTNLLETLTHLDSCQTLLVAIKAAKLEETLTSIGIFTLLAPTDEAFAKLPAGTVDSLLKDIPKLQKILLYHVLDGDVRSDDFAQIDEAPTLEGSVIAVEHSPKIKVNGAEVKQVDILADNGVIHTISAVLMPAMVDGKS